VKKDVYSGAADTGKCFIRNAIAIRQLSSFRPIRSVLFEQKTRRLSVSAAAT